MSPKTGAKLDEYLPLRPLDLQILLVLGEGPLHGYGISKAVSGQSGGKISLEVGSLYRVVGRMLDTGLIEETKGTASADGPGLQRRVYRITPLGRQVAKAEARRLQEVLELARDRRFFAT